MGLQAICRPGRATRKADTKFKAVRLVLELQRRLRRRPFICCATCAQTVSEGRMISRLLAGFLALGVVSDIALQGQPILPPYRSHSTPLAQRVEDLLARMTLEEKIGQMNMPCVYEEALGQNISEKTAAVQKFA